MAPFDAILVTAAPERIPGDLLGQLAEGGRLVVPVGGEVQTLRLVRRRGGTFEQRDVTAVRFVPLLGAAG
jgi:protein-L-isoaspartate(D-aspartate) O-methyltransferase